MAIKEKKKSKNQLKSSCNKEPNTPKQEPKSPKLWPDLPQQLIYLIERQPTLIRNIFSRGVTKSWRAERSKCNPNPAPPWLQLTIDDQETADNQPCTFNIWFKRGSIWYCSRERPRLKFHDFYGCSHGVLVCKAESTPCYRIPTPYFVIRDPAVDGAVASPLWDAKDPVVYAASSSNPVGYRYHNNKCTVIVLTGIARPAFAFYKLRQKSEKWIKKDSSIIDPYCSDPHERAHLLRFTNGIWFKDKFYALSLHGTLAVIEDIDSDLRITALGKKRAVPSVSSKRFRECMIESEGGILLVFIVSRDSINVVDCVEIYQLNIGNLTWTKKESLRDVTLIMGANCCMSVSASRVGCRRNCVYFTLCSADGWWVYDLETGIISTPTKSLHWANPTEICLL